MKMITKRIPDGYTGKMTWAVVIEHIYGYDVVDSGFSTKAAAQAWIAKQL
jgi:hypothetical protein